MALKQRLKGAIDTKTRRRAAAKRRTAVRALQRSGFTTREAYSLANRLEADQRKGGS
jgi:hypothetical protein